jgi:hypothetical protein
MMQWMHGMMHGMKARWMTLCPCAAHRCTARQNTNKPQSKRACLSQRLPLWHKRPGLLRKPPLQTAADVIAQFENAFVGDAVDDIRPLLATS